MRKLFRRLRYRRFRQDLADELDFHRTMAEQQLGDAHAARRAMGNETLMREDARAVWIAPWLDGVMQDVRHAVRSLIHSPSFAVPAIAALALAIGINTSVFTVYNAVAIRPWPVKDPHQVITVHGTVNGGGFSGFGLSEYRYMRDHAKSLSGAVAYRETAVRMENDPAGKSSGAMYVTGDFFDVLGVPMALGRGFRADEAKPDQPLPVAVISWRTWQTKLGANRTVVGTTIRLDDVPFTIVGVTAEEFTGTSPSHYGIYLPIPAMALLPRDQAYASSWQHRPDHCCSNVAARLAPGVSRGEARAELDLLSRQFQSQHKLEPRSVVTAGTQFFSAPGAKRSVKAAFSLMFAGVTLVLLLACANVGNLCVARSLARRREFAVRASIGAGRWRIVRQLLTEGLIVALAAAAAGIGIAVWLPGTVIALFTENPPALRLDPDWTVLAYALLMASASTMIFGLAPALSGTRLDLYSVLKGDSTTASSKFRLRTVLLGVQTALSVLLLVAAGLMTRGVQRAATLDPGFAIEGITVLSIDLPASSYISDSARAFNSTLVREVQQVSGAALTMFPPLGNSRTSTGFTLPGRPGERQSAFLHEVSPDYFKLLKMPVVAGRAFTPADSAAGPILVNEAMARRLWPNESAIGKSIITGRTSREVIGVARNANTLGLGPVEPAYFLLTGSDRIPSILVRSDPAVIQQATAMVHGIERTAVIRAEPLRANFDRQIRPVRNAAALAGALAIFGLLLAALGLSGVCAYVVQQRTREIGVRMALGARRIDIIRFVLAGHGGAIAAGLVCGMIAAILASRLLVSSLYGVSPLDPITYAGVLFVLVVAGLMATLAPARRAAGLDPLRALRYE
jgi:predicted permease